MNIHTNLKINGSREKPILLDIYFQPNGRKKPLVLFCHGFKGFKDWGHFNLIAEAIADAGFVLCKFNFSYNGGTAEEPIDFPDLEAFGNNNISTELDDLGCVIDAWHAGGFIPAEEVDPGQLSIIGHSRGGGVCILKAAEDGRVQQLVTLAAVGTIGRLFTDPATMEHWRETGVLYIPNGRTKQQMPMYYQYYEDFIAHRERLDIPSAAAAINIPWLIIHGTEDPTVDVEDARALHRAAKGSELLEIGGADHTFGGKHPWTESTLPKDSRTAVNAAIEFLRRNAD